MLCNFNSEFSEFCEVLILSEWKLSETPSDLVAMVRFNDGAVGRSKSNTCSCILKL